MKLFNKKINLGLEVYRLTCFTNLRITSYQIQLLENPIAVKNKHLFLCNVFTGLNFTCHRFKRLNETEHKKICLL